MESPFYPSASESQTTSFALYLEPILDSYSQTYRQVITLSCMPSGPLASMVKMQSLSKLSPFYSSVNCSRCSYILMRYPNSNSNSNSIKKDNDYMYSDDIPAVFSYLTNHGYTINQSFTKMMNGSRICIGIGSDKNNSQRLICFVSFINTLL